MNNGMPESPLEDALGRFDVIMLENVPLGAQMERIDRKFAFPVGRIPEILDTMESFYSIVMAAGKWISLYNSTYLDTEDLMFFRQHQRGYLSRSKIRFRSYPNTGTTFLEIKLKSNKGRTAKSRIIRSDDNAALDTEAKEFIRSQAPHIDPDSLHTSARVDYRRIQFISERDDDERFSIDYNISAHYDGREYHFGNIAILEVKQDHRFTSAIIRRMRQLNIREASMSKYCLALTKLKPELKSNRFKADLQRLRKIQNEEI